MLTLPLLDSIAPFGSKALADSSLPVRVLYYYVPNGIHIDLSHRQIEFPLIAFEAAMNAVDLILTGGAKLTWWVILPMLVAGFLTPWPYNYWRLKKYGVACH